MSLTNTTRGIGRFFWHSIRLKKRSSLVHIFPTHETDYPYRWSKSLVLRLPWATYGIVLGWWRDTTRTEEEAILAGMQGRDMSYDELLAETMDYDETFQA